jgi:hypothetical protein
MNSPGRDRHWLALVAAICCAAPVLAQETPGAVAKPAVPAQKMPQTAKTQDQKSQKPASKQSVVQKSVVQKPLDLRVPDITELYTPEEIEQMLAGTRDDGLETVEVRGARVPLTPDVWGGLAAPVWGLLHPAESWRIIAPVPPDRIHAADVRPDAAPQPRDPFRP